MRLENALKVNEGDKVIARSSCDGPHKLTKDKSYDVKKIIPIYRGGFPNDVSKDPNAGPLCNVDFGITNDLGVYNEVPFIQFL